MKRSVLMTCGLLFATASIAQDTTPAGKSFMDDPINHPLLPYFVVFALLAVTIVLVTIIAIYVVKTLNILNDQIQMEASAKTGIPYVPQPGWWERFSQRMNASVPVEQEKNIDLGHSYDGIRELDNHLPPWWKWLFYGTIGWSVVYIIVFHFSNTLPLSGQEYQNELAQAEEQTKQRLASQPQSAAIDENTIEYKNDPAMISKGKTVFESNPCGSCHRNDGGGNTIGPNLTDEYWIHGGSAKNIYATIKNGAVEKGMPAWGKAMSAQDVRDLTFYIMSLQGTNPPDAKAPQGDLFKFTVNSDSTKQASL